ncbi:GntR family transcriptional regulator [Streptomyces sp. SL13]|uniref:GntR family transcriptional regulator n=1 Tax=Streptantibioticus silvisoli TaxID=2705255 RepID=A0AA90H190_9ACTN|nr:GntR family transcriptional regulator [Streptantibioticus silvisoli]MDI5963025.1 GntR family transcriptional regulator [Streptantibioticus silvisoli]MDI5968740.1 GntR family transcriptional regulator [Streptantibioticus silvisoli]
MSDKPTTHAAERVYRYTKDLIIRGALPGGRLISEGSICDDLGVSRTPVHEAFLRLDTERLLALSSRKGAVVLPMAPQEARDVLEMREAIEGAAAQRVVDEERTAPATLDRLRSNLAVQAGHAAAGDLEAFVEADEEFHRTVVEASGNEIAGHFYALLRDRQQRLRHHLLAIRPDELPVILTDHRDLVGCLERRDADAYRDLLRAHVARNRGAL